MSRIVVAGGGVAALESCLALRRHLGAEELEITLLTPSARFEYRPLSVLESFEGISRWSLALSAFASDLSLDLVRDALAAVGSHARVAVTGSGAELGYDLLLVATGGHAADAIHGAITFRGPADGRRLRALLDDPPSSMAFAAPAGASWPLPLYELALMSAAELRRRGAETTVVLVTPEETPLAAFGASASESAVAEIADRGIELITGADPVVAREGMLELRDGRRIEAESVIAVPRLLGRRIEGIPHDAEDFIVVDEHCRVVRRLRGGRRHQPALQARRSGRPAGRRRGRGHAGRARRRDHAPAAAAGTRRRAFHRPPFELDVAAREDRRAASDSLPRRGDRRTSATETYGWRAAPARLASEVMSRIVR
jgi:sulfide:quinone oxidoreductase